MNVTSLRFILFMVFCITSVYSAYLDSQDIDEDDYTEEDEGLMREARREGGGERASCTREMCSNALETGKVGKACVKSPFCVRKFLREHKKIKKQQSRMDATMKQRCAVGGTDQGETQEEEEEEKEEKVALEKRIDVISNEKRILEEKHKENHIKNENLQTEILKHLKKIREMGNKNKAVKTELQQIRESEDKAQQRVQEVENELKAVEVRSQDIVKSLELVETQQAVRNHNLSQVLDELTGYKEENKVLKDKNIVLNRKFETQQAVRNHNLSQEVDELAGYKEENKVLKEKNIVLNRKLGKYTSQVVEIQRKMEGIIKEKQEITQINNKLSKCKGEQERCRGQKILEASEKEGLMKEAQEANNRLEKCQNNLEDMGEVNSKCKEKIGELGICKSELAKLGKVVQDRLTTVKEEKRIISTVTKRNKDLENILGVARDELESLGKRLNLCQGELQELETKEQGEERLLSCDSPCTISKLAGNDLIMMEAQDNESKKKVEELKQHNRNITKELDELKVSLETCRTINNNVEDNEGSGDSVPNDLLVEHLLF